MANRSYYPSEYIAAALSLQLDVEVRIWRVGPSTTSLTLRATFNAPKPTVANVYHAGEHFTCLIPIETESDSEPEAEPIQLRQSTTSIDCTNCAPFPDPTEPCSAPAWARSEAQLQREHQPSRLHPKRQHRPSVPHHPMQSNISKAINRNVPCQRQGFLRCRPEAPQPVGPCWTGGGTDCQKNSPNLFECKPHLDSIHRLTCYAGFLFF